MGKGSCFEKANILSTWLFDDPKENKTHRMASLTNIKKMMHYFLKKSVKDSLKVLILM